MMYWSNEMFCCFLLLILQILLSKKNVTIKDGGNNSLEVMKRIADLEEEVTSLKSKIAKIMVE